MNKAGGYIAIHRQITEWEWYKDSATKDLFIHLLVTANFKNTRFMGKTIRRGQVVTSLPSLAEETGLSIQNCRTAIKHLISTGEITDKSNRQYRVITIVKYDDYQTPTDNLTVSQQTANRQLTDSQQYHNNDNKDNKGINKYTLTGVGDRAKRFSPPSQTEVENFCKDNGIQIDVGRFIDYYTANGWKAGRNPMKDWKATVRNWARRDRDGTGKKPEVQTATTAQGYHQRDYSEAQEEAFRRMMEEDV